MAFDQTTRNRLQQFVSDARALLTDEFTRQLHNEYGMDPNSGEVTELAKLAHLDDSRRETARLLRSTREHYLATNPSSDRRATIERIVREQAFTVLNRLCALRMAEARGLLIESIGKGYQSKGFQLYSHLAGTALGETGGAFRNYIFSLFDEFAVDLGVLFDRFNPNGRLFPREAALLQLLEQINHPEIDAFWTEDETIGWIYQYFNSKEERKKMREESAAPRNSRELAVRNQFFTPRYVVEFLTDNTLGRIWYEMTQGQTALKDRCRYLVRRPDEVFLSEADSGEVKAAQHWLQSGEGERPELWPLAHTVNGYIRVGEASEESNRWVEERLPRLNADSTAEFATQELLDLLFLLCRKERFCEGTLTSLSAEIDLIRTAIDERIAKAKRSDLSQEELLKQPVFIPHRPIKDPRDIKMLDPACGSMHFGLYAFDLFEVIYDEYFGGRLPAGIRQEEVATANSSLPIDFPRLIIERNIHGIDIDPRAVQIAGLSLWLRAQKSWQAEGVKPQARPPIQRSNIVCAEPMPGEANMLDEFAAGLQPKVLGQLVKIIFEKMKLAGEAGSLLKIEEEIEDAIQAAHQDHKRFILEKKQEKGYFAGMAPKREATLFDFADLPNAEGFWNRAEELLLAALKAFAERVENDGGFQRRLFAEDAARGFAFIDVCRKRYDVALMNPPFGDASHQSRSYLSDRYPDAKHDLAAAFVERAFLMVNAGSSVGCISTRTLFFLPTSEKWRKKLFPIGHLGVFADLGLDVMDAATVYAAAYTFAKSLTGDCIFFRGTDWQQKQEILSSAIGRIANGTSDFETYVRNIALYEHLPGWVIPYYLPPKLSKTFSHFPPLGKLHPGAKQGIATSDDFRFVRAKWEISGDTGGSWLLHTKGGEFSPYYVDLDFLLNWGSNGREVKAFAEKLTEERFGAPSWSRWINAVEYYFRPGLTFTYRSRRFGVGAMPSGAIFGVTGMGIFFDGNADELLEAMAVMNSSPFNFLLFMLCERRDPLFQAGKINSVPWPAKDVSTGLSKLAASGYQDSAYCRSLAETSPLFVLPFNIMTATSGGVHQLCHEETTLISAALGRWSDRQQTIDRLVSQLYGIDDEGFTSLRAELIQFLGDDSHDLLGSPAERGENELVSCLVSFLFGIAFGRWDIRYATGEQTAPELPDPFAPLSACPPGQLQNAQGLPASPKDVPAAYPVRIPWDGILVDDPNHSLDLECRVREVIETTWKDRAEAIEHESCEILSVKSLRDYFRKPAGFFADHLKRYSKSRRQAPIYWPLSTASGSYTLWIYYHRLTDQTLYTAVNDCVEPKLKQVATDAARLRQNNNRNNADEKELEQLTNLEQELKEFRDELLCIAKFWKPNLNDGVQITAAPLWKLFRLPIWQKKLKQTWQELEAGDYDWAHLAFSIWHDRVKEKCKTDKSLAIAHGLESLYVELPKPAKKKASRKKVAEVELNDDY
jgi:hypothetical protein